ncbi:MAG: OsmC family protein [Hyphomicrobiaceae bacterium]|nr:OsmC family protein [Hyphomicrobiaceae bacterium]
MQTTNTASTLWTGTGKSGEGRFKTKSGILDGAVISFRKRFEGETGTNPEEIIAAAHAGCFSMALAVELEKAGFEPKSLETKATVTLAQQGDGFAITRSDLKLDAKVPGIDRERFAAIAEAAKTGCPVSKLLNAEITLDWKLT